MVGTMLGSVGVLVLIKRLHMTSSQNLGKKSGRAGVAKEDNEGASSVGMQVLDVRIQSPTKRETLNREEGLKTIEITRRAWAYRSAQRKR